MLGLLGLRASRLPWAKARQQVLREVVSVSLREGLVWALGESLVPAWPPGPWPLVPLPVLWTCLSPPGLGLGASGFWVGDGVLLKRCRKQKCSGPCDPARNGRRKGPLAHSC